VARNAWGLALLVALALTGCSRFSNKEEQEAKASEAKLALLRARTDSLRKARRLADSLAQVRQAACVDSVKVELVKAAAMKPKKSKKSKKQQTPPMSEEAMLTQAQAACSGDVAAPQPSVALQPGSVMPGQAEAKPAPAPAATPALAPAPAAVTKDSAKPPMADAAVPSNGTQQAVPAGSVDSMIWADSVRKAKEIEMSRETFSYGGAARDPFMSLLNLAKSGPELADLQLVGIYQNLRNPSGSVAVFREKEGGKRHKLRAGDQVGRSRLVQIRERDVVFMIEDFGFERQETLSLRKQEDVIP
jgi:hypothetical protein